MKYKLDLTLSEDICIALPTITTFHFEIEDALSDEFWIPSFASIKNEIVSFEHKTDYYLLSELNYLKKYLKLLLSNECPADFEIDFYEFDIVFLLNPFGLNDKDFEIRFYLHSHHLSNQFFSVTFEKEHARQLIDFFESYLKSQI